MMDTSLIVQYIIIAAVVLFAVYTLYRKLKKNFSPKKFQNGKPGKCDQDCGCS